jgi:hypothetical protein
MKKSGLIRFRLRTLIVAIAALSIAMGILANVHRRSEAQRAAVAALTKRGWIVKYDSDVESSRVNTIKSSLGQLLGKDYVSRIRELHVINEVVPTDSDLATIGTLGDVRGVYILSWHSEVGDQGICSLAKLPGLETLVVKNSELSDRGLECLISSQSLTTLAIGGPSRFTGEIVPILSKFQSLKVVELSGCELPASTEERLRLALSDIRVEVE